MRDFTGSNYNSKLSVSDIAKIVKKTIEQKYPYMVVSVKKDNYKSIRATILDFGFSPFLPEYEAFILGGGKDRDWSEEYNYRQAKETLSANALAIQDDCNTILQSYNYDNSDPMTDLFDVNFYGRFEIDTENHKKLYLSESPEVKEAIERNAKYAEQDLARKAKRDERKQQFSLKYGDLVTTEINYRNAGLKKEFALINKVPNGTSRFATTYDIEVLKLLTPEQEQIFLSNEAKYAKEGWQKSKRNKYIGVTYIEGKPYGFKQNIESRYQESLNPYDGNWTHWLKEAQLKEQKEANEKAQRQAERKAQAEVKKAEPKPAKAMPAVKVSEQKPATKTEVITIRRNEKQKGIEVVFSSFPSDESRNYLKSIGFKWSSFNKLWFTSYSDATWNKVNEKFGAKPAPAQNQAFEFQKAKAKAKLILLSLKF